LPPPPPPSSIMLLLHGFACASCTEAGRTVSPAAKIVATANTAAIKAVVFFVDIEREYESIRIFELRRIRLLFSGRYI
jgi:hypothetical protein